MNDRRRHGPAQQFPEHAGEIIEFLRQGRLALIRLQLSHLLCQFSGLTGQVLVLPSERFTLARKLGKPGELLPNRNFQDQDQAEDGQHKQADPHYGKCRPMLLPEPPARALYPKAKSLRLSARERQKARVRPRARAPGSACLPNHSSK